MSIVRWFGVVGFFFAFSVGCALPTEEEHTREVADSLACLTGSVPVRVTNESNRAMDVVIESHDRVVSDRRLGRGGRDAVTFARRRGSDSFITVRAKPSSGGDALAPVVVSAERLDVRIRCSGDDCWMSIAESGRCR